MLEQTPQKKVDPRTGEPYSHDFISVARAEMYWIEKARKDPLAFIYYISGKKPARHHIDWISAILSDSRVNIIAPRESGKTTILVLFLAWLIAKDPLKTHFIGSVSAGQAEDRLDMIRELIDTNARFKNVFPDLHIDPKRTNNKSEFTVWSSANGNEYGVYRALVSIKGDMKNPTICAFGIGSSQVIGKRFSGLALIDDIHSEANSATAALRQKVDDWFNRTLLPCVKEEGRVAIICTRWAPDDQSGRIQAKPGVDGITPLWVTIETPALNEYGESYWPEYFSVERLNDKRAEVGETMFKLMYLNDPHGLSSGQFTLEMLRRPLPDPMPKLKSVVVSVDLAVTVKSASDYTVFAAMGRDDKPRYDLYLLNLFRNKMNFNDALDALFEFCDQISHDYYIDYVLFENQALTIPAYQEFTKRETPYKAHLVPLKVDKGNRLGNVGLKAQRGGFFINQGMPTFAAFCSELISFPKTPHDDIVDAVSLPLLYWGSNERSSGRINIQSPFML